MQFGPENTWYLAIAIVAFFVTWNALLYYKDRGVRILRRMAKGELEAPSGHGSWYARNITTTATSVIYGVTSNTLAISAFWLVVFVFAPADFSTIFSYSWVVLPILIMLGIGCGIEPSYKRMVEEESLRDK
ncbi:MAG: hypothetical protein EAX95_15745 [Candidatus Thorarchaeota archaeon]|nr:hypothetical protein [Candidatus Thorarchaeota archaeon]